MDMSLEGKVAIVTGAGDIGGMGASFARALAEAGASVMVADINDDGLTEVERKYARLGLNITSCQTDISNEEEVEALAEATVNAFGHIDILVNNAALMNGPSLTAQLIDVPLRDWQRVFDINLTGTLLCCRAVVPHMKSRGGGKIINIASSGAFEVKSPYSISKLGVVGLTAILSDQLGKDGINVNAIAPGFVQTRQGLHVVPPGPTRERLSTFLRPGVPADIHGALLLLASSAGDWITGQTLNIDGGLIKRI